MLEWGIVLSPTERPDAFSQHYEEHNPCRGCLKRLYSELGCATFILLVILLLYWQCMGAIQIVCTTLKCR
jgi:hypothetical protein